MPQPDPPPTVEERLDTITAIAAELAIYVRSVERNASQSIAALTKRINALEDKAGA